MKAAARILRQEGAPNIAAMEFSGWDTHANQGLAGGALDRLLGQLAEGLMALRTDMGSAWSNTTVVVTQETATVPRPLGFVRVRTCSSDTETRRAMDAIRSKNRPRS